MSYTVKEIFDTLQGEGARSGARSVFIRFAGCNLWNGTVEGRAKGKGECAMWCDTDFVGGEKLSAAEIEERAAALWPAGGERWVVLTGGEPTLQVDEDLIDTLHAAGWRIAMETNGTRQVPRGIDWLTVSPKIGGVLVQHEANELKVILPGSTEGKGWVDEELEALEAGGLWQSLFVQAQDPIAAALIGATFLKRGTLGDRPTFETNAKRCVDFIMGHPRWRLSFQVHKAVNLP